MPLLVIEQFIITFHPNGPKGSTSKEVPNFDFLAVLFRNSFSKDGLFPIKTTIVVRTNFTKFMHDVCCPTPNPPSLYAIPKLVFNRLTCIEEAKHTLFVDGCRCTTCSPFVDRNCLVPNGPNRRRFFARAKGGPKVKTKRIYSYQIDSLVIYHSHEWSLNS